MIVASNRDRRAERREATRQEILAAAWESAASNGLAGLTLRDVAARVGMQAPSLYFHFDSKNALYDAMFQAGWQAYLDHMGEIIDDAPAAPRARLVFAAEDFFDFAVANVPRYQLMNVSSVPGFQPSPEAYAPSLQAYELMRQYIGFDDQQDADLYSALISGLVSQQLANDPGGQRWRRLITPAIAMFADHLGLPPDLPASAPRARKKES
jgi:AcrR family transcriptional regulator